MNAELLRVIDTIHRDKDISLDILFAALEDALASALRKKLNTQEEILVKVNRETGQISVEGADQEIDAANLGRIAAQTAKQVIIQKIREAERDVVFRDYETRLHDIVNGTVQRTEAGHIIVNLGKTEGILPRREQIRDENYRVGDRLRCYVLDVKKIGSSVKIILSRSHPDLIKKLFELEVPEIAERIIEIKTLAREPGYRTKIAVSSVDTKVDAVGACVGVRGTRIKNIVAEVGGEKIDIVRWSDQHDIFIANALNPAEIEAISLNPRAKLARVIVAEDQLSRAIGALGQNVRLASKLTGWDIDVMSQQELDGELAKMRRALMVLPGIGEKTVAKLFAAGFSMKKLATTSLEPVLTIEGIGETAAKKIVERAAQFVAEERQKNRQQREAAAKTQSAPTLPPLPESPQPADPADEEQPEEEKSKAEPSDKSDKSDESEETPAADESESAPPAETPEDEQSE